jgi:uncharacterized repeat protein (TIGR03803 family)
LSNASRAAVTTLCAILLASCAQTAARDLPSLNERSAATRPLSSAYQILAEFTSVNGANPDAAMIAIDGKLYGTTENGGESNNGGVLFSVTPQGAERTLWSFGGPGDGRGPNAGLVFVDGRIYGTTKTGGKHDAGTVFRMDLAGHEHVLYSFKGGTDGRQPHSTLLYQNGLFYGTTYAGGQYDDGTAYLISKSGSELVMHTFGRSYLEGGEPNTGFVVRDNKLYSATYGGGKYREGIAYSLTLDGTEAVLHNFGKEYDGTHPYNAQLLAAGGVFYGTTCDGGQYNLGTVYMMTAAGQERVLYSFGNKAGDPACPTAGLVLLHGVMYGTSYAGGAAHHGTIFSITYGGKLEVLYSFAASGDGAEPAASLTVLNGTLYGTTRIGGKGYGIAFKYRP